VWQAGDLVYLYYINIGGFSLCGSQDYGGFGGVRSDGNFSYFGSGKRGIRGFFLMVYTGNASGWLVEGRIMIGEDNP
jgi:hypothetical protein